MLQRHRSSLLLYTICICIVYNLIRYADPMVSTMNVLMGSSPRMRGSPYGEVLKPAQDGIIPAHAGLTSAAARPDVGTWDHPRACGAHTMAAGQSAGGMGSSPRMRGSPTHMVKADMGMGIIPAYTGLTFSKSRNNLTAWDHPRVCGAHRNRLPKW